MSNSNSIEGCQIKITLKLTPERAWSKEKKGQKIRPVRVSRDHTHNEQSGVWKYLQDFLWSLSLEASTVNAVDHSCIADSDTFSSPIKGAQDPREVSVRTHLTFSGTLEKSSFEVELFDFMLHFFGFWPSEPFMGWKSNFKMQVTLVEQGGIISKNFQWSEVRLLTHQFISIRVLHYFPLFPFGSCFYKEKNLFLWSESMAWNRIEKVLHITEAI